MKKLILALICLVFLIAAAEPSFAHKRHKHHKHHAKHRIHRPPPPPPIVTAQIDLSDQTMAVNVHGWPIAYWRISSAREGYHTPRGTYRATRTAAVYFSKKYDNSPMPNSVFFYGGYAIHGTYHISKLGRPASHGCIRLAPRNAARFYAMVKEYGKARTRIKIVD